MAWMPNGGPPISRFCNRTYDINGRRSRLLMAAVVNVLRVWKGRSVDSL